MIKVSYVAQRELTALHIAGDTVTLSFSASDLTPSWVVTRDQQKALGGRRETLRHNTKRSWNVTTAPLDGANLEAVVEFLGSVAGGESFTFEPWRYETGPSLDLDFLTQRFRIAEAIECVLDSDQWSLSRLVGDGTGGANDVYQVSFQVAES